MSYRPETGLTIEHDDGASAPVPTAPALESVTAAAVPPSAVAVAAGQGRPGLMLWSERVAGRISLRLRRLGPISGTGLALLFAALILVFSLLLPLQRQVAALETALERNAVPARAPAPATEPTRSATAFVSRLPARTDLPLVLATVLQQARAAGLNLDQGSYEMASGKSRRVGRYSIQLPVEGSYPQLRQFIDATLLAVPAASVDSLRLQREKVGSAKVAAEIRFTVFVREVDAGAAP